MRKSNQNMKKAKHLLLFVIFVTALSCFSQTEQKKWAIDFGSSSVLYEKGASSQIGYRYLEAAPRIGLTKYIFKDVSIAGGISGSIVEGKDYISLDSELRYGFGTSNKRVFNLISIYGLIGGSYLPEPLSITLNFGGGGTLWVSDNFGLTARMVYKYFGLPEFPRSHIYASGGFIYQFSLNSGSGSKKKKPIGGKRDRIWQ